MGWQFELKPSDVEPILKPYTSGAFLLYDIDFKELPMYISINSPRMFFEIMLFDDKRNLPGNLENMNLFI